MILIFIIKGLASASERIQMLQLAVASNPWIHVSEWETQQDDWLPTREVLQYHKVNYHRSPETVTLNDC